MKYLAIRVETQFPDIFFFEVKRLRQQEYLESVARHLASMDVTSIASRSYGIWAEMDTDTLETLLGTDDFRLIDELPQITELQLHGERIHVDTNGNFWFTGRCDWTSDIFSTCAVEFDSV